MERLKAEWYFKETKFTKDAGKVFSTFSCAGGSTMGYKLSGFDVIGCNEIDPEIFKIYKLNHNPKYSFVCSIRDLIDKDLPEELYNLDILDGSPPCSTFSTAGNREKDWNKEKQFKEGQKKQRLDDLFFSFIELASKLKPKIVVAENVLGMIKGKAKGYIKEIGKEFDKIGYKVQLFKLYAHRMGVPQQRGRIFFVCRRKDLNLPDIKLYFNEKPILYSEVYKRNKELPGIIKENLSPQPSSMKFYFKVKPGETLAKAHPKGSYFNRMKVSGSKPLPTLTAHGHEDLLCGYEARLLSTIEFSIASTFPLDYNWGHFAHRKAKYCMGMSVPPYMMNRIANEIKKQWGTVLNGSTN